jgi:hypothetical protein
VTPELGVIFDFITEGSLPENVRSLTLPSHLILLAVEVVLVKRPIIESGNIP